MVSRTLRWVTVTALIVLSPPLTQVLDGQIPEADSLTTSPSPDSAAAPPGSPGTRLPRTAPPVPAWFSASSGYALTGEPMARTRFAHAAEALAEDAFSFLYDMGIPGRPIGWSLGGLGPGVVGATLNEFTFVDPLTRMPLIDLLPVELLEPVASTWSIPGFGPGLSGRIRPLGGAPPLTEIRYNQGSNKLQSVSVLHSQDRTRTVRGHPTRSNVLFRYGGRGSTGAYPGSNTRLRQVYVRFIHERPGWLLEASYLRTHAEYGAQAGVLPRSSGAFDSIYETFSPTVRTPGASTTIDRHDVTLRWRTFIVRSLPPTTAGVRLAPHIHRGTTPGFSYRIPSLQLGTFVHQPLGRVLGHAPLLVVALNSTTSRHHPAFRDSAAARYVEWSAGVRDSARVAGGSVSLGVAMESSPDGLRPRVESTFRRSVRSVVVRLEGAWGYRSPSHADRFGFGSALTGLEDAHPTGSAWIAGSARLPLGPFAFRGRLFVSTAIDPLDYHATSSLFATTGTIGAVVQQEGAHRWAGAAVTASWREDAHKGLFARMGVVSLHPSGSVGRTSPHASSALPAWQGEARAGVRARLFSGDLNLTSYLRGRSWSAFRSRTFQPETGLFLLPTPDDLVLGPSGTLDFVAVGGIRTATVFVTADNLLAGTFYPGTLQVPLYPLPRRSIRFGIYWPLLN